MLLFQCDNCGHILFFENSRCHQCDAQQGILIRGTTFASRASREDRWLDPNSGAATWTRCANADLIGCNWLVDESDGVPHCAACRLNRTIPPLDTPEYLERWKALEAGKRRVLYSLYRLGIPPIDRNANAELGLCFDFLASSPDGSEIPLTGHSDGVITINIGEADPAQCEAMREEMNESYRTVIGHFRHEFGHHYWDRLAKSQPTFVDGFRSVFGDERRDYAEALRRHHESGPPEDWAARHVSAYASSHPWEDWAECWAHYLHILDTTETAHAFGLQFQSQLAFDPELALSPPSDPYESTDFEATLQAGSRLSIALNSFNRGMGHNDFYPFAPAEPVLEKIAWVHRQIRALRDVE